MDFAASAASAFASVERIVGAGEEVSSLIRSAAASMLGALKNHPEEIKRIAKLMGRGGLDDVGMRVASVVWFDSLLMMNELAKVDQKYKGVEGCKSEGRLQPGRVKEEWDRILDVNYKSVFAVAEASFPEVPPSLIQEPFQLLGDAVRKVEEGRLGKAANIGGEVFAQVMEEGERKRSAAFYTTPEHAEFLTHAVFPDRNALPSDWRGWRIGDFACGTGTLLRSAYLRARRFAASGEADLDEFHLHMMEKGLCGLDISPIAVHLTAAGIVGLHPQTTYENTNIGGMSIGEVRSSPKSIRDVRAGSVELLDKSTAKQQLLTVDFSSMKGDQTETEGTISVLRAEDLSFDAVLMNPPYSRTRGGQAAFDLPGISKEARTLIQRRVRNKLTKGTCGNMQAGLSTVFAAIADRKLREGGRLGLVLPLTAAASGGYTEMRKMFETDYRDVTVVTIGGRQSISADTSMGELMMFARKGKNGREGVAYAYIDAPFFSANAAAETARVVVEAVSEAKPGDGGVLSVGTDPVGRWYADRPTKNGLPWCGAGIENLLALYPTTDRLTVGIIDMEMLPEPVKFPMMTIGDLFEVGPTHDKIGHGVGRDPRGAFTLYKRNPAHPGRDSNHLALWASPAAGRASILTEPTHYGIAYRKEKASEEAERKANLFYQRGMGWTSQAVLVAATDVPALGGRAWAPLRGSTKLARFAFAVWANSVFGFVNHWMVTQRQQPGRSQAQVKDTGRIPCPDFTHPALLNRAERLIPRRDELFSLPLDRAVRAPTDTGRRKMDLAAGYLLGIPKQHRDAVADWFAEHWAREPSVTGKKHGGKK